MLNKMGKALGLVSGDTYRNVNGVYMKLMNFRRIDPRYTHDGKVGLRSGNKDEKVVWDQFAFEPDRLDTVCKAIENAIDDPSADIDFGGIDEPGFVEAEEGRVLTKLHRFRERNRKLVQQAKAEALRRHGRLFCQACGFDFKEKYGERGEGVIDVHHTKPVHTLGTGDKTHVKDLALLCANCHRMVHSSGRWLSVEEVAAIVGESEAKLGDSRLSKAG